MTGGQRGISARVGRRGFRSTSHGVDRSTGGQPSEASVSGENTSVGSAQRFHTVDALRGVAAVAVVLFHLFRNSPQTDILTSMAPGFLKGIFDYSRSGVMIFFVISGFVITYSTRSINWRPREAGRFIARRQIRLDPPYYVVIAIVLLSNVAQSFVPSLESRSYSILDVIVNAVYLQGILDRPAVLSVAWTLCLEVQFYLLVLLAGLLFSRLSPTRALRGYQTALGLVGVVSLVVFAGGNGSNAWFINLWWMYFTGVVLCWLYEGKLARPVAIVWMGAVFVTCLSGSLGWTRGHGAWGEDWTAWATGMLIFALIEFRKLAWRPPRLILWFGAISYSLYLIHLPVIDLVMGAGYKITGESQLGALLCWIAGAACSVLAAVILHRFVEAPSIRLARRVTTPRSNAEAPTTQVGNPD